MKTDQNGEDRGHWTVSPTVEELIAGLDRLDPAADFDSVIVEMIELFPYATEALLVYRRRRNTQ